MSEENKEYCIEFRYLDGQSFQTGAFLTASERVSMERILTAYEDSIVIAGGSVFEAVPVSQDFDQTVSEIVTALECEVADKENLSVCQGCDFIWPTEILPPVVDLLERVAPGEIMPSGECPACGAVCHFRPKT